MVSDVQPDTAAVELDDLLADGQADTRTAVSLTSVEPLEDDEYLVCESRLDADPVVFDGDDPVAVVRVERLRPRREATLEWNLMALPTRF